MYIEVLTLKTVTHTETVYSNSATAISRRTHGAAGAAQSGRAVGGERSSARLRVCPRMSRGPCYNI